MSKKVGASGEIARERAPSLATTSNTTENDEQTAWANAHAAEIEQYNAWASQREPYAQRVRRWRDAAKRP